MAATFQEDLMAEGLWSVELNYRSFMKDKLVDESGEPRDLSLLVWDTSVTPRKLAYPPLVYLRWSGDERGLTIGGAGPYWLLGSDDIGPTLPEGLEYLSGVSVLSNGDFSKGGLYWRRPSEDSLWIFASGLATNLGGRRTDDVLEFDRKFPAAPGQEWQARMEGVTGTGRIRLRQIYEGRYNPANLLQNGDFEQDAATFWSEGAHVVLVDGGQRSGTRSLQINPIPKPQLLPYWNFPGFGWSADDQLSVVDGTLICDPIPYPQLLADPGLELETEWTFSADDDIGIEATDEARSGAKAMVIGPITQKELLLNWEMATDLSHWGMSSNIPDPSDPGLFYWHATDGFADGPGATTNGGSPVRTVRYLRADYDVGEGIAAYPVTPGEQYECSCFVRRSPSANGHVYMSVTLPHPDDIPRAMEWNHTETVTSSGPGGLAPETHRRIKQTVTIPPNRFELNALFEVHDFNVASSYWTVSQFRATRTRGNRVRADGPEIAVEPNSEYRLSCRMRTLDDFQVGNVMFGAVLRSTDVDQDDLPVSVSQGFTDYRWAYVKVEFTPQDTFTEAALFFVAEDIVGDPMMADDLALEKISNNTRETTHPPVPVTAGQRYQLASSMRSLAGQTRGEVRIGVVLSGPDMDDTDIAIDQGNTEGKILTRTEDFTPNDGYDTATAYVRFKDVEGAPFQVFGVTITKMDNNTDKASTIPAMTVTPERTYRWTQAVRSGPNLQRGSAMLSVTCKRDGFDNVVFDSEAKEGTGGEWKFFDWTFTPPSGYDEISADVVGIDVEGDDVFNLDEGEIRDTDDTTYLLGTWLDYPVGGAVTMATTAPAGTESVHVAVVVEADTGPWSVGAVSLTRITADPSSVEDIVANMLVDASTGQGVGIVAGTIDAPQTIPFDWKPGVVTYRAGVEHVANVVAIPPIEHNLTATDPPALDAGATEDVFTDHHPDSETPVVFLPRDIDVVSLPRIESDVASRATEIVLLGAEFETVSGQPFLITATAPVPGRVRLGPNGLPIKRTKRVHIPTVDHDGYADARVADLAQAEADPPFSLTVEVNEFTDAQAAALGRDPRPPYVVGDRVYLYKPDAGIRGDEDSATMIEGQTVFPLGLRVLSRTREIADIGKASSRYQLEMRAPDGTVFPLTGVRPSDANSTTLIVGERFQEWESDPQGQGEGDQFLADRQFRTR